MVGILILNYNLDSDVRTLVNSIIEKNLPIKILIVDNYHMNMPKVFGDIPVEYICTGENLGYGGGNNVGFDYFTRLGISRVLVLNPDIFDFRAEIIFELNDILEKVKSVGAVSPLVFTTQGLEGGLLEARRQIQVRRILPASEMFLCSTILRKIFPRVMGRFLYKDLLEMNGKSVVDSINGACFMIDLERTNFRFSDKIFLYFEEIYLGYVFKAKGLECILHSDVFVRHKQGMTTGSRRSRYVRERELQKLDSELVVYREFGVMNNLSLLIIKGLRYMEIGIRSYV